MTDIAHNRPWITDQDRQRVDAVLQSGWIAPGPETKGLEDDFCTYLGGGGGCALSSGTAALFVALKGLGLGPRHQVALPTYACSALLNAVHMAGATPVIVDIREDDFTMSAEHLATIRETQSIDATIAVHMFGATADVIALETSGGAQVIEDCCQSLGSEQEGLPLGTLGAAAVFSFYATKIITGGHGGLVWGQGENGAKFAHDYRAFDGRDTYTPRFNLQMTDFQSAMVRSQFSRLPEIVGRRQSIAAAYMDALPDTFSVMNGTLAPGRMPYRFIVRTPDVKTRDNLRAHMQKNGVQCIVPVERFELLHRYLELNPEKFPRSERVVDTTLSLPLYPALSNSQVEQIADVLGSAPS